MSRHVAHTDYQNGLLKKERIEEKDVHLLVM